MATFKSKMRYMEPDWADRIWERASEMNGGMGAAWRLGAAALAVTGARPASLELGITFSIEERDDVIYVKAHVPGAKIIKNQDGSGHRGQDYVDFFWRLTPPVEKPVRSKEFQALVAALLKNRDEGISDDLVVTYGADAIGSSIRMLSKSIWPRKKYHVSPICYREAFSEQAKSDPDYDPRQLALAMGHISAESQGKYLACRGKARGRVSPKKLFSMVEAPIEIKKLERSPLLRFKQASISKRKQSKIT